jgi:tetratricopeptide (TPR) repeat protein
MIVASHGRVGEMSAMASNSRWSASHRGAVIGVVAALVAFAGPATADDLKRCHDESGDSAIAACTRAIGAKLPKRSAAIAYTSRGVEWRRKGEVDRAIADHTQAIKFDPNLSEAFYNRGNAYGDKGDNDHAIADYDQAIRLNPKSAGAFNNRGLARRQKGDTAGGDADIARAKQLEKR